MSLADQLKYGAGQSNWVDADMLVETLILIGEQHRDEARIDILGAAREPPSPLVGSIGTQQLALAIEHAVRRVGRDRRRPQRDEPASAGNADQCRSSSQS